MRFPHLATMVPLVCAVVSVASLCGGCDRAEPLSASSSGRVAIAPVPSVRGSDGYRTALRAYKSGNYAAALPTLDTLLQDKSLSETDRAFLRKQQTICQTAAQHPAGREAGTGQQASSTPAAAQRPDSAACGPRALLLICREQSRKADLADLMRRAGTTATGTTLAGLQRAARSVGFAGAAGVQMNEAALQSLKTPAIAWVDGSHYVAVAPVNRHPLTGEHTVVVRDPNRSDAPQTLTLPQLLRRGGGILLTLSSAPPQKRKERQP